MSENHKIKLGPLLGIEGDYSYTVTFLSDLDIHIANIILHLKIDNSEKIEFFACKFKEALNNGFVYKFEFTVKKNTENCIAKYSISDKAGTYFSEHASFWKFEVPGIDVIPKIAMASCNGEGGRLPDPQCEEQFSMWRRLRTKYVLNSKNLDVKPFHCLLLTGDQIYADLLWKEVPYFKEHNLTGWKSFFFGSKKIEKHIIAREDIDDLEARLYDFYEKTYINSWTNIDIATALASVPSVMMWDDHDIFDGWGSHSKELQESELFVLIFKVAKDFFEKLQIRGSNNKTRICTNKNTDLEHYSSRLSFRNFEILTLDNRSLRTRKKIMSDGQYEELEHILNDISFFENVTKNKLLNKQRTILFIIPVPVAHLDYSKRAEGVLRHISKFNFQHNFSLGDDALDHWSHTCHNTEKKNLIDLIFSFGETFKPKYIHIISGDVHSAGVGRIKKLKPEPIDNDPPTGKDYRRVNQLVSSAIVHKPVPRCQ